MVEQLNAEVWIYSSGCLDGFINQMAIVQRITVLVYEVPEPSSKSFVRFFRLVPRLRDENSTLGLVLGWHEIFNQFKYLPNIRVPLFNVWPRFFVLSWLDLKIGTHIAVEVRLLRSPAIIIPSSLHPAHSFVKAFRSGNHHHAWLGHYLR